ncbi:hypothetical protein [Mycobacterium sp. SMC-4]|uniref:hypothetical protein n=1 Tax=Mycobacterium sp. SMC-4 TaxID=2857059 RepID=UPI0021B2E0A7|nr:hypothetical protein [Mycobacterium sp. SMC-4]UXA19499.1 hypothetical protein KXD98_07835 [Mycobacterium sp. SMC-4]
MTTIRAALVVSGIGAVVWALLLSFIASWFCLLAVVGALLIIAAYWPGGDPDCGFDTTVFGPSADDRCRCGHYLAVPGGRGHGGDPHGKCKHAACGCTRFRQDIHRPIPSEPPGGAL